MENLLNFLLQYGHLNAQQQELIAENATVELLEKDAYFSEAGQIANRVAFVNKGILRVCYYNREGDEITRYFVDENKFAVDLNSFQAEIPSAEYVQAIVPTELLVFDRTSLKRLSHTIIGWDAIVSQITSRELMEKVSRISPMMAEDAKTRYLAFFKRYPQLAHRIPLNYLASYIGITKHSLSRIRRELSQAGEQD